MISRVCRVGAAVFASLTVAATCLAAEPGGGPRTGSIGGMVGGSTFAMDRAFGNGWFADYSNGASPRFAFEAHWRYSFTQSIRTQIALGFTWTGYSDKHEPDGTPLYPAPFPDPNYPNDKDKKYYLTQYLPVSAQLQYVMRRGWWDYHIGAGPGVHRVWVTNRHKVLKDPVTLKLHSGLYPAVSGEFGVEKYLKDMPAVSLEFQVASHLVFSQRPEQFVSGYNSNMNATEFKFGANYHFVPGPRKAPAAAAPKLP